MKPTCELRWVNKIVPMEVQGHEGITVGQYAKVLQQKFEEQAYSVEVPYECEWRDVPIVEEQT